MNDQEFRVLYFTLISKYQLPEERANQIIQFILQRSDRRTSGLIISSKERNKRNHHDQTNE